jgi:polysaccharide deacetylase 2 family uncharacterized protein YibQ
VTRSLTIHFCLLLMSLVAAVDGAVAEPARIAIVIDDIGYQAAMDQAVLRLDPRVAIAVIPDGPEAKTSAQAASASGREVLIHLPLPHPHGNCLYTYCPTTDWTTDRLLRHLEWAGRRVPGAVGISNHQGSLFTSDPASTGRLVESLRIFNRTNRPLFVLDSRTTPLSQLATRASQAGLRVAQRQVFLDHDRDPAAIRSAWHRLLELAQSDGQAIAIGHPYPETIDLLLSEIPALDERHIQLAPLSDLIAAPPVSQSLTGNRKEPPSMTPDKAVPPTLNPSS